MMFIDRGVKAYRCIQVKIGLIYTIEKGIRVQKSRGCKRAYTQSYNMN